MAGAGQTTRRAPVRAATVTIGVLVLVIVVFAVIRVRTDWPSILAGRVVNDDDFAQRYIAHPWISYGHIGLGMVYLLGAPFQLSRTFRSRHYTLHRRMGRVLLACGLASGVLALVFGVGDAWGGSVEAAAAVVFGGWFLVCLVTAFVAIRGGDVRRHRRFMVRAFAVGLGVGTIRLWVGIFTPIHIWLAGGPDDLVFPVATTFGLAFWLGLGMHVVAGEWWVRRTPELDG